MPTVLALMAHPDDIEITCAGTLILLKRQGWSAHLATMTAGDLGSATLAPAKIARVRRNEAAAAAKLLGAGYTCLGLRDLTVARDLRTKRLVTGLIREVRPDLIIVPNLFDYMTDHTETPVIVREAAFASTVPHWKATFKGRPMKPCAKLPVILYADPIENVDSFGRRVPAGQAVDITDVVALKEKMLAAHESQRSWLRKQHGEDEYLHMVRRFGADRARDFAQPEVAYAEGFTQHLGHGFPKEDVLTAALGTERVLTLSRGSAGSPLAVAV